MTAEEFVKKFHIDELVSYFKSIGYVCNAYADNVEVFSYEFGLLSEKEFITNANNFYTNHYPEIFVVSSKDKRFFKWTSLFDRKAGDLLFLINGVVSAHVDVKCTKKNDYGCISLNSPEDFGNQNASLVGIDKKYIHNVDIHFYMCCNDIFSKFAIIKANSVFNHRNKMYRYFFNEKIPFITVDTKKGFLTSKDCIVAKKLKNSGKKEDMDKYYELLKPIDGICSTLIKNEEFIIIV